jgi:HSP20 family protein
MPTTKSTAELEPEIAELPRVDEAISSVERLYETLTGSPAPPPVNDESTPIPVERDAAEFLSERLDRLIDALGQPTRPEPTWSPLLSVWEEAKGLLVALEVAGITKQDIKVIDEGQSLLVTGERKPSGDGLRLQMSERPIGPFRRQILLPRGVSGADATARLHDGLLEIRIPKSASSSGARPISIT